MNISFNWLRELVPSLGAEPEPVAEWLSMRAAAVETIEAVGDGLFDIRVARVLEVGKHPNADRLSLCRVDSGFEQPVAVVCGAPVIAEGGLYPHIPVGATLPDGLKIEAREIRGEISHGMLCSESELGLGRDSSGIFRLADGLEPGTSAAEALGLPDHRLGLDLNPNRIDLASHIGVARELLPPGEVPRLREFGGSGWSPRYVDDAEAASGGGVSIWIQDPGRCSRYLAAIIRGVKVGPSPAWLAGRLLAIGARPINNIVDATNYVLHELNQPLHAFDLSTLRGPEIRVRRGAAGEQLQTLDRSTHELNEGATVIADAERPIALAGVMGGLESEVTEATTDVLIECALFDRLGTRGTAAVAGLATDASYRFERGVDPAGQERALERCVELILAIAGGEAESEAVRVGVPPAEPHVLGLRPARVRQVLGIDLPAEDLDELLTPLGFARAGETDAGDPVWQVPTWRGDVEREIDLVEEVARRFGYENFPAEPRKFRPSVVPPDPAWRKIGRVRELFNAAGLLESRSLSFVPGSYRGHEATVAVPNPLSADESYLRSDLVPVLLRRLEHNYARAQRDVRLYEVGTVFSYAEPGEVEPKATQSRNGKLGATARFHEEIRVAALVTGRREPPSWSLDEEPVTIWDLKGLAERVGRELLSATVEPLEADDDPPFGASWLDDNALVFLSGERPVGVAGRVRAEAVDRPPWAGDVWALEFLLDAVRDEAHRQYVERSAFPPVSRDLAIVVDADIPAGEIAEAIRDAAGDMLDAVRLFDVYEGEGVEPGHRSLAWAFRFRAPDRTLTDAEIEPRMNAITRTLEEGFDARVRSH